MEKDVLFLALAAGCLAAGPFWAYERFVYSKKRIVLGSTPWGVAKLAPFFPLVAVLLAVKVLFVEPVQIPSGSMRPTLSPGSLGLALKPAYGVWLAGPWPRLLRRLPARGDVVIFHHPTDANELYVKRVLGFPGERVEINSKGKVFVDGKEIARTAQGACSGAPTESGGDLPKCREAWTESWGDRSWTVWESGDPAGEEVKLWKGCLKASGGGISCLVPDGEFFVMGDNRSDSYDSRHWGGVPEGKLSGKLFATFSFQSQDSKLRWVP